MTDRQKVLRPRPWLTPSVLLLFACDPASGSTPPPDAERPLASPAPEATPGEVASNEEPGTATAEATPNEDSGTATAEAAPNDGQGTATGEVATDSAPVQEGHPAAPALLVPALLGPTATSTATSSPKQPRAELPAPVHTRIEPSCGQDSGVGSSLHAFELKTPDGKTVTDRSYRNRVLLVNFWGTWCEPCLKELPEFDRIYRRYRALGLTLIAIATDEDAGPVQTFVDRRKIAAKILLGGQKYAETYASNQFPFTFVVDSDGEIVGSYFGYKPECLGKLEADIRRQLQTLGDP